uniref:RING-type domain-containing protein n=1 Tax=Panagrolaimus sp. ES5 TaxID=591445 RepID=A0AC34FXH5_9BILA
MEPEKWCLLGLQESLHTIDAAQKHLEKNPSSSRIFVDVKKNIIDIFRGLSERVSEHFNLQHAKLKKINDVIDNKKEMSPEIKLFARNKNLEMEIHQLRTSKQHDEEQITGYQEDLKKLEDQVKLLSADAAHTKCERCKHKPRDVLFLPCRHFIVCEECSKDIDDHCLYCGAKIDESLVAEY